MRKKLTKEKKEYPYKRKKYWCSVHKGIGHPECLECRENLKKLCEDKNIYLTGDFK